MKNQPKLKNYVNVQNIETKDPNEESILILGVSITGDYLLNLSEAKTMVDSYHFGFHLFRHSWQGNSEMVIKFFTWLQEVISSYKFLTLLSFAFNNKFLLDLSKCVF